ncbi:MAG: serine/threonine protein phosphatase [Magnetococcales bacterium]|nr:serine/threonine protein phosphatase [Magnetococcales bacterium]
MSRAGATVIERALQVSGFFRKIFSGGFGKKAAVPERVAVQGPETPATIPSGLRIYAVGDIHGRADLLGHLLDLINVDALAIPATTRKMAIFLGDYIDRGDHSREVIDRLLNDPLPGFETVFLKGNHESEMMSFLAQPDPVHGWLQHGGQATLFSYRVRAANRISAQEKMMELRDGLLKAIPKEHQRFYSDLRLSVALGDYLFVHAGVRPGVALERQNPVDLMWIREPFLSSPLYHGRMIVHGHTVTERPITLPNRIGIDTGAYYSARLTCLVLEGETRRILST